MGSKMIVGLDARRSEGAMRQGILWTAAGGTLCLLACGCAIVDGLDGIDEAATEVCEAPDLCGGCHPLRGVPGEPCGVCETGQWACVGASLICEGDAGPRAFNACGGCDTLERDPGEVCGVCSAGVTVCAEDRRATFCLDDLKVNACGGCALLTQAVGASCGPCLLDTRVCDGQNETRCEGQTPCPEGAALIPATVFVMGSQITEPGRGSDEGPQHLVTLSRPLMSDIHEVTQARWVALTDDNPAIFEACGEQCPVENVNWFEAIAFANSVSRTEGLETCYKDREGQDYGFADADVAREPVWPQGLDCEGWRLPTEAEWEHAARAHTATAFFSGPITETGCAREPSLSAIGRYCFNSAVGYAGCADLSPQGGAECAGTNPVGGFAPNGFGLRDTSGNVWEWVWDWYAPTAYTAAARTDPIGPPQGDQRVVRGGSWGTGARSCRNAERGSAPPEVRRGDLGLRLVRSLF